MAFLDSDLLLVGRGGGSFRATAQALKTYVESGDGLTFRGSVDLTSAPVSDPNPPAVGDLYINTTAGTVDAGGPVLLILQLMLVTVCCGMVLSGTWLPLHKMLV